MSEEIIRVTKLFTFDMAHALYGYDGACKNIHGHTYHLYVTIKGRVITDTTNPKNGMVLDFSDLKRSVKRLIIDTFDHALVLNGNSPHRELANLNQEFDRIVLLPVQPSCENLMLHFKNLLQPVFQSELKLVYIKLLETPTSYAEWFESDN